MPIPPGPAANNSVSSSASDLINSALRLINVLAANEQPTINESNDALAVFNAMVDSWNADRLTIFTTTSTDFAFVLSQQAYTLGAGGDFNMARPPQIDSMSVILSTNPANPIELPISMVSVSQWQTDFPVKAVNGSIPLACYDDGGFPLRTLNFWPIPTMPSTSVRIYSWQPLSLATLQTTVNLPPGYARAFRYNLAVELAPEYGKEPSPTVLGIAAKSLGILKTMNAPDLTLRSDIMAPDAGYSYAADMFGLPYSGVPRG